MLSCLWQVSTSCSLMPSPSFSRMYACDGWHLQAQTSSMVTYPAFEVNSCLYGNSKLAEELQWWLHWWSWQNFGPWWWFCWSQNCCRIHHLHILHSTESYNTKRCGQSSMQHGWSKCLCIIATCNLVILMSCVGWKLKETASDKVQSFSCSSSC